MVRKKKACLFVLCCLLLCLCWVPTYCIAQQAQSDASSGPRIEVVGGSWDFGEIKKGQVKERLFRIRNSGDEDLVIEKIEACCGYDVPYISSWTIKPNEQATAKATCDSTHKPLGTDEKAIIITSNDKTTPDLKVKAYASIVEKVEEPAPAVPSITPAELYSRRAAGDNIVILDVREESEFSEKHIPGAINCPKSRFRFSNDEELMNLVRIDRTPTVVVHCGGGFRSSYITRQLREHRYNAFNLEGGLSLWAKEGYPVLIGPKIPSSEEPLVINLQEAYEHYYLLFKDNALWVDVRSRQDYQIGHIKASLNIPLDALEQNKALIPQDKEVVLYCSGIGCGEAASMARVLIKNGFKQARIKVFEDGYSAWENSGYPVEKE